jgi:Mannosyl-glycoprotein endo-beta-N-acetylglucosaminidase
VFRSLLRLVVAASAVLSVVVAPAARAEFLIDVGNGVVAEEVTTMRHVPTWVQVVSSSAPLYGADTGNKAVGEKLQRFTYLRVLGAANQRLQVEVSTESGQPGQRGWIDPDVVLPSASSQNWRVTSNATTLWMGADSGAASVRTLDRFTPLQQVDGPVQGRIEVRVYRSDFLAVLDQGWVDQAQTGPAFAPATRVPDPTNGQVARKPTSANQQQAFLDSATQAAMVASAATGVPASVTVAQAILESDWGRSTLAQSASNYFGMKALGGLGNDGVVWMPTAEFDANGQAYTTISPFRAYRSLTDSLVDHDRLLSNTSRYSQAMQAASNPRQFAQLLAEAGYATDPQYADKLIALMDRYDLYRLDA